MIFLCLDQVDLWYRKKLLRSQVLPSSVAWHSLYSKNIKKFPFRMMIFCAKSLSEFAYFCAKIYQNLHTKNYCLITGVMLPCPPLTYNSFPASPIQLAIGTKTDKRRMLCAHERIVFQKRANIPKAGHIMFCMKTNYVCWTWDGFSLVCYGQVGWLILIIFCYLCAFVFINIYVWN